ncbi:hypothetical protein KEM60_02368 [Austwickia sp. TVS 96-490-7B]|uniref:OB-fold nucleic acid binding domain-containing protein n=1 Tax=Austwickia sp. TVS 96-490-7B TaxID=2830843 RepID=UPI001C5A28E2|nr:OB-fold nucleic acid binding domain-containing protein [Austwickia sp. TVS 96-490-7B]MBW3086157.1 hypothetical protein [Austwickia sp. TVS 96-490-7B]
MASFLSRMAGRLARSPEQVDAEELSLHCAALGTTHISAVPNREVVEVSGELRSLTLPPRSTVPTLTAELYDGTGTMTLVWLGRREIPGISPGVRLRVRGRATYRKGSPTIFNPQYQILPRHHGD